MVVTHLALSRLKSIEFYWEIQIEILESAGPSLPRTTASSLGSCSSLPLGLCTALEAVSFNPNPASVLFNFFWHDHGLDLIAALVNLWP
jgi:hypothetical protein